MALNVEEIPLKIEFGGGLELLFSNQRSHRINLPGFIPNETSGDTKTSDRVPDEETSRKPADVNYLLRYLRDNLLKERVELFMENDTIRPGILILINDADWELEGEGEYQLKAGDEIVFISTLHGG